MSRDRPYRLNCIAVCDAGTSGGKTEDCSTKASTSDNEVMSLL